MNTHGFTLIELLVVIAIIGILASVILASLNSARTKGNDAAIKSNLANARIQAELFYDTNGNSYYGSTSATRLCYSAALVGSVKGMYQFMVAAQKSFTANSAATPIYSNAAATPWNTVTCHSSVVSWAIEAPLNSSTSSSPLFWCVDSTGAAKQVTGVLAASKYVCPAS